MMAVHREKIETVTITIAAGTDLGNLIDELFRETRNSDSPEEDYNGFVFSKLEDWGKGEDRESFTITFTREER